LKGRYYWNKPFDDGLNEAIAFYERAIATSPRFSDAHAALARARVGRAVYYNELPRQALQAARASAARALELDRSSYEGLVATAEVLRMHDFDWAGAEAAYMEAIALNPSNEIAHRAYAAMLGVLGRHEDAIREAERACEVDPLCLTVATNAAWVRYAAGDYAAAIERCCNTIDMDPQFLTAHRLLGAAYLQEGRQDEAFTALESAAALAEGDPLLLAWLAHAKAVSGRQAEARSLIARARALESERYVPSYHLALAYAGLDDRDAAFAALEQAWLDRDPDLAGVAVDPRFDGLRADSRYAELAARLKMG
jgi:tetratricopeptide (TPR) repeat protein